MLVDYIEKLVEKENLTFAESSNLIEIFLSDECEAHQIAAILVLLKAKGETVKEIAGIVSTMRSKMLTVELDKPVLDIVGTGGDIAHTINISTISSLLAASCGVSVMKHGNRAVSSSCGSADVLEEIGVNLKLDSGKVKSCFNKVGMGFCFAPNFHPAMGKLRSIRKGLGVPTCFNIIGPLLNPAKADFLMIGVYKRDLVELVANVLKELGVKRALVFYGNGLDEISTIGTLKTLEIKNNKIHRLVINPADYGFDYCKISELQGGDRIENAKQLREILSGKLTGPKADTVILNAGVANYLFGLCEDIKEGVALAQKSISSGKAIAYLDDYIKVSNEV